MNATASRTQYSRHGVGDRYRGVGSLVIGSRTPRRRGDQVDWPWVWGLFVVVLALFVAFVVTIAISGELQMG